MNKQEFLTKLRNKLHRLPKSEVEERISFYSESIDDRIEDGILEEQAVEQMGSVQQIAEQIIGEIPLSKIVTERIKPKRKLKGWEITLLVLGSPLCFALLISAFAIFISLYLVLWSLILSLWAVEISLCACAIVGVVELVVYCCMGKFISGLALFGLGILSAGLFIFALKLCKSLTKGTLIISRKLLFSTKSFFIGKEVE